MLILNANEMSLKTQFKPQQPDTWVRTCVRTSPYLTVDTRDRSAQFIAAQFQIETSPIIPVCLTISRFMIVIKTRCRKQQGKIWMLKHLKNTIHDIISQEVHTWSSWECGRIMWPNIAKVVNRWLQCRMRCLGHRNCNKKTIMLDQRIIIVKQSRKANDSKIKYG